MKTTSHFLTAILGLLWSLGASAHRPSDAFLELRVEGASVGGQWEIALRDLATLADLDRNRDRALSWGELRIAQPRLSAALREALHLRADGAPCPLSIEDLLIHDRSDGRYAWFTLRATCGAAIRELELSYALLFEVDPTHRGLLTLRAGDAAMHSAVLGPDTDPRRFVLAAPSRLQTIRDYSGEGVWHIWVGYDHVLFLLALLLPAVLQRTNRQWQAQPRLVPVLWNVAGVVTAFTLAHSVTLTLAALGWVRVPGALVESAIALSVLLAALNNLWPLVERARWQLALIFGLIHGFGFASVLGELGLPAQARLIALLAFNLGVEAGQLAIVAIAVPLAYTLRRTALYRRGVLVVGSLTMMLLAACWLAQRSGMLSALGLA